MKNLLKIQFIICLYLVHSGLFATDYNKTRSMFSTQKNVDATVSKYSRNMATIFYNDTLFNFINYNDGSTKIILRKIHNKGTMPKLNFEYTQSELSFTGKLEEDYWQPAPVFFKDSLLLFVSAKSGYSFGAVKYLVYDPVKAKFSDVGIQVPGNYNGFTTGHGMAAVVLDEKLCLITHDDNQNIRINWTKDLKTWNHFTTTVNINKNSNITDQLSAVTVAFLNDTVESGKIVLAWLSDESYLGGAKKPWCAEYYFSNDSTLTEWGVQHCIYDSVECSSVTLAAGTISCPPGSPTDCKPDLTSTHECVQAFLKHAVMDNGNNCYRILRIQRQDTVGEWRCIESNVIPQNAPNVLWACKHLPLTSAILPIPENDTTIRQFMCLVFQGVNGANYPLNISWAETNKLIYDQSKAHSELVDDDLFQHYIGYIEGPPPFSLNRINSYVNIYGAGGSISELVLSTSSATVVDNKIGFNIGFESKTQLLWFNINIGANFGKQWSNSKKITKETRLSILAQHDGFGYYIKCHPEVTRQVYHVIDVQNHDFSITYYYYISDAVVDFKSVPLGASLVPSNPLTYTNKQRPFNPGLHSILNSQSIEWNNGTSLAKPFSVQTLSSTTTSAGASIYLGAAMKRLIWKTSNGFSGTFNWSSTTTFSNSYTITPTNRMNWDSAGPKPHDYTCLKYNAYWLQSTSDNDWWLPQGYPGQHPWCIMYQVYSFDTVGGDTTCNVKSPGATGIGDPESSDKFWLSQNYPNPFSGTTTIAYKIGNNSSQNGTVGKGLPTQLFVTSMTGNLVAMLVDEIKTPGNYTVNWNTSQMQPGIYFYTLQAGNFRDVKKLILLK